MSQAVVRFRLPGGRVAELRPGGIIGRMPAAALRLPDPRVPEAAAMVSLRGRDLHLLALRGALEVNGEAEDDVLLAEGQVLRLAGAVEISVEAVTVPGRVLALQVLGETRELCAPSYSLVGGEQPELLPTYVEDAVARAWSTSEGWVIDAGAGPERIAPGRSWEVAGISIEAVEVELDAVASAATVAGGSRMTLVLRSTTAHIQRPGRRPYAIDGLAARVLTELG